MLIFNILDLSHNFAEQAYTVRWFTIHIIPAYRISFQVALFFQFLHCTFQFRIPFFAETAYERFFQETVNRKIQMPALHHGHLAYIPTMVVQRHTITNLLQTDGIKMAGQRFVERTLPFAVSFLQSTITITALVITREHTIFFR